MQFLVTTVILILLSLPLATKGDDSVRVAFQVNNIFFRSGSNMVHAFIYKPDGKGKFPAIVFNQATREPSFGPDGAYPFEYVARWAIAHGYVLFIPDRAPVDNLGQNGGEFMSLLDNADSISPTNRTFLEAFDVIGKDITAGVKWLREQDFVDPNKIGMIGHSTGAMQTILLATKKLPVKGYVAFSPAVKIWKTNQTMHSLMVNAVKRAQGPLFLIQARNDFGLGPSDELGPELRQHPAPSGSKVFETFGKNQQEAVLFAINGASVWGDDVAKFMEDCWK